MPNIMCPNCDRAATFAEPEHRVTARFRYYPTAQMGIATCPACGAPVMFGFSPHNARDLIGYVPQTSAREPDERIPEAIRADLFDARKCLSVEAYKACAAMCRRALQGSCIDQGATPGNVLAKQIEEVVAANKVHGSLRDWADAIRLFGNSGAHPGDHGLETVTEEEARDVLDFTEQFLDLLYVVADRVQKRLSSRRPAAP